MIALDEDALICDLAETYHIFDYRSLPARRVAAFAVGLRENSRIRMKLAGVNCPTDTLLLAAAVDRLSLLWWAKTRDAEHGRNRPEMIFDRLTGRVRRRRENAVFSSGEAFEKKRQEILSSLEGGA